MTNLKVPVYNIIVMAVIDTLEDLLNAVRGISFAIELSGYDVLEQLTSSYPAIQRRTLGTVTNCNSKYKSHSKTIVDLVSFLRNYFVHQNDADNY